MHRLIVFLLSLTLIPGSAQQPPVRPEKDSEDVRLPSGKLQKEEILKADHQKTLEDVAALSKAVEEFRIEMEKTDPHVLAIGTLKQLDNIEKLTKRIRSRLKKY